MKIVHLVCTFPPYQGGMGNSVKEMVERLALADPSADITIVCPCLLYTSDAADDLLCVDLGGRRIIKKKTSTI